MPQIGRNPPLSPPGRARFPAIRREGGLLPPELLAWSEGDEAPDEGMLGAWRRLRRAWAGFQEARSALAAGAGDAGVTRSRWLRPLFRELGYGRLAARRGPAPVSHHHPAAPIHLVGFRTGLDVRTPGVVGAARRSPHCTVQHFLDRSEAYRYGFVSNGLRLRLLRAAEGSSRPALVELDLEAMMERALRADFAALWRVAHRARLEARTDGPESCLLEEWRADAKVRRARTLVEVQSGVERAIEVMGRGVLDASSVAHGARDVDARELYRELARIACRALVQVAGGGRAELAAPGLARHEARAAERALGAVELDGRAVPLQDLELGAEELGGVYESLLERHAVIDPATGRFALASAAGHERKTTGTYYTPPALVEALLDSTLDPVLARAERSDDPEEALLALAVCDPACGSGHFLVAAAHRMARRLAALRTGDEAPPPGAHRAALRDVIGRCLHGVDASATAVELCKASLRFELGAGERPASLDARIRCGDSLLGAAFDLLAAHRPGAGAAGGFDVVLSNPPWEKIHLRDEEYFACSHPWIARARTKAERKALIEALRTSEPGVHAHYLREHARRDALSRHLRRSGAYPLTGASRINLYSVFTELGCRLLAPDGRLGMVLPSGIVTDDNNKALFERLMREGRLVSVFDFENRTALFPGVHRQFKFCLFTAAGSAGGVPAPELAFFLRDTSELAERDRRFSLTPAKLRAMNPRSRTCPTFRSRREAEIVAAIYDRVRPWCLHRRRSDWPGTPRTPFNAANDSRHFLARECVAAALRANGGADTVDHEGREHGSLYEPKLMHQFQHRFASFVDATSGVLRERARSMSAADWSDPRAVASGRHWLPCRLVDERYPGPWYVAFRDVTSAANERTAIAAILPPRPVGNPLSIVTGLSARTACWMVASMNAFVFDYVARTEVAGTHLSHFIWKQLPFIDPDELRGPGPWFAGGGSTVSEVARRVLELTYTARDLAGFARDCGHDGPPFAWDEERRFRLRAELDAAFFHLYGVDRANVELVMDSFPIVARKDVELHGETRTKRAILAAYDEMG